MHFSMSSIPESRAERRDIAGQTLGDDELLLLAEETGHRFTTNLGKGHSHAFNAVQQSIVEETDESSSDEQTDETRQDYTQRNICRKTGKVLKRADTCPPQLMITLSDYSSPDRTETVLETIPHRLTDHSSPDRTEALIETIPHDLALLRVRAKGDYMGMMSPPPIRRVASIHPSVVGQVVTKPTSRSFLLRHRSAEGININELRTTRNSSCDSSASCSSNTSPFGSRRSSDSCASSRRDSNEISSYSRNSSQDLGSSERNSGSDSTQMISHSMKKRIQRNSTVDIGAVISKLTDLREEKERCLKKLEVPEKRIRRRSTGCNEFDSCSPVQEMRRFSINSITCARTTSASLGLDLPIANKRRRSVGCILEKTSIESPPSIKDNLHAFSNGGVQFQCTELKTQRSRTLTMSGPRQSLAEEKNDFKMPAMLVRNSSACTLDSCDTPDSESRALRSERRHSLTPGTKYLTAPTPELIRLRSKSLENITRLQNERAPSPLTHTALTSSKKRIDQRLGKPSHNRGAPSNTEKRLQERHSTVRHLRTALQSVYANWSTAEKLAYMTEVERLRENP
ncbi:uncharacterized protein LOC135484435 isoform X1 [Lineus longissimus]|uniref:uncharacterized protein LOC135484435 isoform X1 n=1 Tax=Lineus longissimus TaxID=88925 RepID=UPI00315CB832